MLKIKKYHKYRGHCHYTGEYRICNSKYIMPREMFRVFYNGSNYDYHFIIKELAEELERKCNCLGEGTEK